MRCRAEVPAPWPDDSAWQRAWATLVAPLVESRVGPGDVVGLPWPEPVRRVDGRHLEPGATYAIAEDRLHHGQLTARIERRRRTIRATWDPRSGRGRAELVVDGLDHGSEICASSSLRHLEGNLVLAPRPADLVGLRLRLDWLAVDFAVKVTGQAEDQRLVCELEVRGAGLWRPTLAPLLAALHGQVIGSLQETAQDLVRSLAEVAGDASFPLPDPVAEAVATLEVGMDQIAVRLHAVADRVAALPWWRRTARRWRRELAAQPDVRRPTAGVLVTAQRWSEMEQRVLAQVLLAPRWRRDEAVTEVMHEVAEQEIKYRRGFEENREAVTRASADAPAEPWLTDANLDTRWLATPWSTMRRLARLESDAEAKKQLGRFVSEQASG